MRLAPRYLGFVARVAKHLDGNRHDALAAMLEAAIADPDPALANAQLAFLLQNTETELRRVVAQLQHQLDEEKAKNVALRNRLRSRTYAMRRVWEQVPASRRSRIESRDRVILDEAAGDDRQL